jgi:hypothetical protein
LKKHSLCKHLFTFNHKKEASIINGASFIFCPCLPIFVTHINSSQVKNYYCALLALKSRPKQINGEALCLERDSL